MKKYTRGELIQICKDAVRPVSKWNNRDSLMAQQSVQSIYAGLTGGVKFTVEQEDESIWVTFNTPTKKQLAAMQHLNIGTKEEYISWYEENVDEDSGGVELFEGGGIDWNSTWLCSYLPTRKRLEDSGDEDWY